MTKTKSGNSKSQKFIVLLLMIISLCTIYILPYLRYSFFTPLQEAMGLTNNSAAFGSLISVYGIINVICYLPGGFLADKYDPKKLLVFSMVSSGILGLWMGTWPSYNALMIIHILWSITTVLTFWSSSVKCVNMLASSDEQGEMFGFLEGGRGLIGLGINGVFLAIFVYCSAKAGGDVAGITLVVNCVSILMILDGIALAFLLPKSNTSVAVNSSAKDSLQAMIKSFKQPITWSLAGIIFTCAALAASGAYFAPYLQSFAGMTVVMASTFGVIRSNGTAIIASPIAGLISKKIGRSSIVIMAAFVGLLTLCIFLRIVPATPKLLWPLIIVMLLFSVLYAANRAVYWALIDESGTPKNMVGSVIGVASVIGFLPDTFIHTLFGNYLDKYEPMVAYNKIFMFCIGCAILGLVTSVVAERIIKKQQASKASVSSESTEN